MIHILPKLITIKYLGMRELTNRPCFVSSLHPVFRIFFKFHRYGFNGTSTIVGRTEELERNRRSCKNTKKKSGKDNHS